MPRARFDAAAWIHDAAHRGLWARAISQQSGAHAVNGNTRPEWGTVDLLREYASATHAFGGVTARVWERFLSRMGTT